MQTNRNKYTIIFALGYYLDGQLLANEIGSRLTKKYGGCTITRGDGYWAKDGEQDKPNYGEQMVEIAYKVEVVTMEEQGAEIKELFTQGARVAKHLWSIDTDGQWIHFEHTKVYCEHFQI